LRSESEFQGSWFAGGQLGNLEALVQLVRLLLVLLAVWGLYSESRFQGSKVGGLGVFGRLFALFVRFYGLGGCGFEMFGFGGWGLGVGEWGLGVGVQIAEGIGFERLSLECQSFRFES